MFDIKYKKGACLVLGVCGAQFSINAGCSSYKSEKEEDLTKENIKKALEGLVEDDSKGGLDALAGTITKVNKASGSLEVPNVKGKKKFDQYFIIKKASGSGKRTYINKGDSEVKANDVEKGGYIVKLTCAGKGQKVQMAVTDGAKDDKGSKNKD